MSITINRDYLFRTPLDLLSLQECMHYIANCKNEKFAYIVTPNVDHIVRINENLQLYDIYNSAALSLCDSRIIKILAKFCSVHIPQVIAGSDLTRILFEEVIEQDDVVTIVGSDTTSIGKLTEKHSVKHVFHYCPPMGFIHDEFEINQCIEFVQSHPSRFVFFAVGSPQQEILAYRILQKGGATGLGFCIGASINFLTGSEKRAPKIIQKFALEWLFRLLQNPARLWRRYLVEDIKIFPIFFKCFWQKPRRKFFK
jgi:exopolysaccharide biosynthesis WecB/TagA/CpsF family protein